MPIGVLFPSERLTPSSLSAVFSTASDSTLVFDCTVNGPGTVYALALPSGSPTPTIGAIKGGQSSPVTAGAPVPVTVTGLAASTEYDAYLLATIDGADTPALLITESTVSAGSGTSDLTAQAALAVVGSKSLGGTVVLEANGELSGTGDKEGLSAPNLDALADLTGQGDKAASQSAGALTAQAGITAAGSGDGQVVSGIANLAAQAGLTIGFSPGYQGAIGLDALGDVLVSGVVGNQAGGVNLTAAAAALVVGEKRSSGVAGLTAQGETVAVGASVFADQIIDVDDLRGVA